MKKIKNVFSIIMLVAVIGLTTVSAAVLTQYVSSLSLSPGNTLTGTVRNYTGGVFKQKITADILNNDTVLNTKLVYSTGVSSILKSTREMGFSGANSFDIATYGTYSTGDYYYIYKNIGLNYIGSNYGHVIMWTQ